VGTPRSRTGGELKRRIELDRVGAPYLVLRDADDEQLEVVLDPDSGLTVGRDAACDLALSWDSSVSRLHVEFVCRAGSWLVLDDGASKNGTFVNGERVQGRRRLRDGDAIRIGATAIAYRDPAAGGATGTAAMSSYITAQQVSPTQKKVLIALCRPFADGSPHAVPATNRQIAQELVLSDEAIKSHMRVLFRRFEIEDLAQNVKRARLVELALHSGVIAPRDLR
jgi:hypothetical protein